ncbi:MAG: 16S rRNA (cytosine(1402)-N(4))-methyltransferase RsmH [Bacteroidota bacterium]
MENQTTFHTPVLADVVLSYLVTDLKGVYVDATVGGGGHAERILEKLEREGRVVALDRDGNAVTFAQERLSKYGDRVRIVRANFAEVGTIVERLGIDKTFGILLDLGVSSYQVDEEGRGFSFQRNEGIDMRMDQRQELSGWTVVNRYSQDLLADLLRQYGEEKHARRIAKSIVQRREERPLNSTRDLVDIVRSVVGGKHVQKSLARVFQAIRIEVNQELENLHKALHDMVDVLRVGGRIVVISYHSLEDRIVKEFFRAEAAASIPSGTKLIPDRPRQQLLRILTKRPIVPGRAEVMVNSRARSAKLRAAERI